MNSYVFDRLHEQLNESDDAAQCYMLYIQDIFSCGVSILKCLNTYESFGHPVVILFCTFGLRSFMVLARNLRSTERKSHSYSIQ